MAKAQAGGRDPRGAAPLGETRAPLPPARSSGPGAPPDEGSAAGRGSRVARDDARARRDEAALGRGEAPHTEQAKARPERRSHVSPVTHPPSALTNACRRASSHAITRGAPCGTFFVNGCAHFASCGVAIVTRAREVRHCVSPVRLASDDLRHT